MAELWERARGSGALPFADFALLCQTCHRRAPFLFFNGNTFVTIVKLALGRIRFDTPEADAAARTLVGHLVAGTLPPEASTELIDALRGLRAIPTPRPARRRH